MPSVGLQLLTSIDDLLTWLPAVQVIEVNGRDFNRDCQVQVGHSSGNCIVPGLLDAARAEDAPKGNVGFSTIKTQVVELGDEIEGMSGRQLRLRVLKIEPNGHIGIHSHKDRPSVVYFLQGTDTVSSADGSSKNLPSRRHDGCN